MPEHGVKILTFYIR